ncbi:MAG: leucine-rich repeat domain-containing protein [Clostridiales bacterium]|nr:leucine-rich repeat domain-containing protein [Clostridiales bacterium]
MKSKRKIVAIILAVSLVFACSVPSALAADDHVHDDTCGYSEGQCIYELDETGEESGEAADAEEETEESEESAEESLTLTAAMSLTSVSGNGWTLDDNGKLTISSDTGMSNWFSNRNSYMTQVKSVVIEDSVTYISSNAFKNASNLTSASIGSGVAAISAYAFQSCTSLASITINKATTTIYTQAFSGCMSLTDVYYSGSETEWNNISIGSNNNYVTSAFIHYNSSSAHTHTHSTSFSWSSDYSSCTVTISCSGCNSTKTLNCTVTSESTDASITYTAKATIGTETYSDTKTVPRAPAPTVTISGVTTSSITVTAPSGTDQNTYGTALYSIDGSMWQESNVFSSLYAGTSYTVYVKYQGNSTYAESVAGSTATKTADATYTVTIPSTVTAGGDSVYISIDESTLDLGLGGQVDVSVTYGMNDDGTLSLIREGDLSSEVTSQMFINDVAVTSDTPAVTTFAVTTFKEGSTSPVAIRFGEPKEETILAGKYSRTVQFTITFSQE